MDLEKAYNMVPKKLLWPAFIKVGIPQDNLVVIQKCMPINEAHVKIGNSVSTKIL
jgi:hypothetical protein